MKFRDFDGLRIFDVVARSRSFTHAGEELGLTKSAISYQINKLEDQLGFIVFERGRGGVTLTHKGEVLWHVTEANLMDIERCIGELRGSDSAALHIRLSTYFASRWLSPRLMHFMQLHPEIKITIEPAIDPGEFESIHDAVAIRWGRGNWPGTHNELLLESKSRPMANQALASKATDLGLQEFLNEVTLLNDAEESQAWEAWFEGSLLNTVGKMDTLVIKDPNVRAQAVIDGQGVALYDQLIQSDIDSGALVPLSPHALEGYGYHLCYPHSAISRPEVRAFREWVLQEANET